jgi:pseudouridine kinase
VARNIAQNLTLLGHEVHLASVFGDDSFAHSMMEDCERSGIDLSLSSQYNDAKSPLFLSFNDEMGNMQSAVSDIKLNKYLDLDWLRDRIDAINRSDMVVADTLLSADALTFLIDHCLVPLYVDTVSANRALMLNEAFDNSWKKSVSVLKCNLAEARAMTGAQEVDEAARRLVDKGIKEVYLTLGEEGVAYCSKKGIRHFEAIEAEAVNVTGSGDAFFAGVIHAHAIGVTGEKAVNYGLKAACHNVKSETPVNPTLRLSVFDE